MMQKHPFATFVVLAFALSWYPWVLHLSMANCYFTNVRRVAGELLLRAYFLRISLPATILR